MYGVRAPGFAGSGAPGRSIEEQDGFKTEQQLIRRRRPDKEPAPPNRRGHAHRGPLQRRRRPDVNASSTVHMPMTMVMARRRRRKEVQHINHGRAPHVIARRPREVVEHMSHRRVEARRRVGSTLNTDAARRVRALHHII